MRSSNASVRARSGTTDRRKASVWPSSAPTATGIEVVGASALAALRFGEPEAETIAARLIGVRLAAPSRLEYELSNVCLTKIRRQPGQRATPRVAFGLANRLKIETVAVDQGAVLDLAEATGLTAYDASYPWLARMLGGELVTLARRLAAAFA